MRIPLQVSQAEAASMLSNAAEAREKLKALALEMKSKSGTRVPKNKHRSSRYYGASSVVAGTTVLVL